MKKVVIIILNILVITSVFLLIYTNKNYKEEVIDNKEIKQEIEQTKNIINDKIVKNKTYETEIKKLKENYQIELKEQNIWKKMKEKLNQFLS